MSEQELAVLWSKYIRNRMTAAERLRFSHLGGAEEQREQLEELVAAFFREHQPDIAPSTNKQQVFEKIMEEAVRREGASSTDVGASVRTVNWHWRWAAAVLLLVTSAVSFFIIHHGKPQPASLVYQYANKAQHKVLLTLDDGTPVVLDTILGGKPGGQSNARISKGVLAYEGNSGAQKTTYNTLATSNGAIYQLILSDGTKVWLNVLSTIRYPTTFNEKDRIVMISGEAYFDIAPDAHHPFIVKTDSMAVQVLGTRFNITAYGETHLTKTTLLEGSINIMPGGHASGYKLEPGDQAILQAGDVKKVKLEDTEAVLAWMHGEFNFQSSDMQTVFGELGRWYGINIRLEPTTSRRRFTGIIPRSYELKDVLTALRVAGIEYHIDGNTIVVTK